MWLPPGQSQAAWGDALDPLQGLDKLVAIMDRLRSADGCPWDREQDYRTLRGYLLEEAYEVAETLDHAEVEGLCEELGDLLFQIVFLSRIAKEESRFTIDDVIAGITEKMIRRHPHVFADDSAADSAEVLVRWEEIKRQEKADAGKPPAESVLDGIPSSLPALLKAQRLGTKASRVGFDWGSADEVWPKVEEELAELTEALAQGETESIRAELGDLLFSLSMLARHLGIDAEEALQGCNDRFGRRFRWIERSLAQEDRAMAETDLDQLEQLWRRAKVALEDQAISKTPIRRNRS